MHRSWWYTSRETHREMAGIYVNNLFKLFHRLIPVTYVSSDFVRLQMCRAMGPTLIFLNIPTASVWVTSWHTWPLTAKISSPENRNGHHKKTSEVKYWATELNTALLLVLCKLKSRWGKLQHLTSVYYIRNVAFDSKILKKYLKSSKCFYIYLKCKPIMTSFI